MNTKWLALIGIIAVLFVAGFAVTTFGPKGPTTVRVTESEWNLKLDTTSIPAGKVTFQVSNHGQIEHEMVVLKTDLAVNALAMSAEEADKVDEEAGAENVGEVEDIAVGTNKNDTFDLAPGKYVLICNVPGHYKAGMAAAFEVK